jgi:glycosyltransferase involved in cell wall biosynthesis
VPYSVGDEVFVQDELAEIRRQGTELLVVPMRLRQRDPNDDGRESGLARDTVAEPLLSARVVLGALATLVRHPVRAVRAIVRSLLASGGRRNLATNLTSAPKALWLARLVEQRGASHIHAYWLGHTATTAMVASAVSGIPWSASGYRWDIDAANALDVKLRSARFVRCADELGRSQLEERAARVTCAAPIVLVRTGVAVPHRSAWDGRPVDPELLCCPAIFVEKKGHAVLLAAFRRFVDGHPDAHLDLFGAGPDEAKVRALVADLGLGSAVTFRGHAPLDELRAHLRSRRPACVLASIKAPDGQEEGIPVTLIEAMANGAPVVSTRSGSIPTLVLDGCGVLVAPGDVDALAAALEDVAAHPDLADGRCRAAYDRLVGEYDLPHTAARLVALWSGAEPR